MRISLVRLGWAGVLGYMLFLLFLDWAGDLLLAGVSAAAQPWIRFGIALGVLVAMAAVITWRALKTASEAAREEALLARRERLTVLGRLAAGISHDAANTLALVAGHAEVAAEALKAGALKPSEALRAFEEIHRAAIDGAAMVRRLQHFGRMTPLSKTQLDPSALVREVVDFTRPRWRDEALARGVTLDVEVAAEARSLVFASPSELREALVNLLFNAIDAMPTSGRITVSTSDERGGVTIAVVDSGVGMSEAVRERAFDPFFSTKGVAGTGLGLAMVHESVERAGGSIELQSRPGHGSRVAIWLPAAVAAVEATVTAVAGARPLRVLAVDDDQGLVQILQLMLEGAGHMVTTAVSGSEALTILAEREFDVMLTDLSMPRMNGWELAQAARMIRPALPIGLVTGWGSASPEELSQRGVAAVLAKPYHASEVRAFVDRLANSGAGSVPLQSAAA